MTRWQPESDPGRPNGRPPGLHQWNETGLPRWDGPQQYQPDNWPPRPQPRFEAAQQPQAAPPRRRRGLTVPAVAGAAVLAVAATAAALVWHHGASAKPLTCGQQYTAWKSGAGKSEAAVIEADGNALTAAGNSEDIKSIDEALAQLGKDAGADESHPMPACADPAGYWQQILADMKASGDNAQVTPGLGGLLTAEAPIKPVKGLEAKLHAELVKTTGPKS